MRSYIMRKGLHPSVISYFYEISKPIKRQDAEIEAIPKSLDCRQDLITVLQTKPENYGDPIVSFQRLERFRAYLKDRKTLGYDAQVAMSAEQYQIFHKYGLVLLPNAIYEKLARVNKNCDAANFVKLMMHYGEVCDNNIALQQIAGDEKLTALWLDHLAEKTAKPSA